ncbi:MAG: prepilin-type N-terminal cleavage/methylation domain-containing protein [Gammaproteobacteria bacterium]
MLLMLNNKYRTRGIGLLELMLSLAIIALLLIMATRYYSSAKRSKEITEAMSLIQAIRAGANNYATPNGFVPEGDIVTKLINAGLLPKYITVKSTASPWGTAVDANTLGGKLLTITMAPPPTIGEDKSSVCPLLLQQALQSGAEIEGTVCAGDSGALTVKYKP